jgi:hypothetical protein
LIRRREVATLAVLAAVLGAGPTVGDIGACGRTASDLDLQTFALSRKAVDCQRCSDCGLGTQRCQAACDPNQPSDVAWPSTCHPLEHDGEVCLDALRAAGCSDYATFVDDVAPATPSECDFCHVLPEASAPVGEL